MTETKRDEFENDPGWDTMDQDEDEVSSNLFGVSRIFLIILLRYFGILAT